MTGKKAAPNLRQMHFAAAAHLSKCCKTLSNSVRSHATAVVVLGGFGERSTGQGAIDHLFEIGSVQRPVVVPIESDERFLDGNAQLQVYHAVLLIAAHVSLHRDVLDLFSRAFVRDERRLIRIPAEVVPETPQILGEGHVDEFREIAELVAQSLAVDRPAHLAERVNHQASYKLVRRYHAVPVGVLHKSVCRKRRVFENPKNMEREKNAEKDLRMSS